MSVKYSIAAMKNPSDEDAPYKYYAKAQAHGETDYDALCEDVNTRCTATRADIGASIDGTLVSIQAALRRGEIVRFGNFGSFQVQLSRVGAESERLFNTSYIKKARIQFRPGKMLLNMLKTLDYELVPAKPKKPAVAVV